MATPLPDEEIRNALLAKLLAWSLGDEANIAAYHVLVGQYPATAILCAYETAKNLPSSQVKKSRGAYFTFLLQRLCPQARKAPEESQNNSDIAQF